MADWFHGSISRSRAAASPAPAKFGMRPCGGNGKARHALSGKPVPNPLPRSALVGEAPGHEGREACGVPMPETRLGPSASPKG